MLEDGRLPARTRKAMLDRFFAAAADLTSAEILDLLGRPAAPAAVRKLDAARDGSRLLQSSLVRELDGLRVRLEAARDPQTLLPPAGLAQLQRRITATLAVQAQSGPPVELSDGMEPVLPEWCREMQAEMAAGNWLVAFGFARAALAAGLADVEDSRAVPYVWQDLALVHYYNGRLAEAERIARRAIREADERQATATLRGSLQCLLGIVLGKRGDGDAALAAIDEAEHIAPGHWLIPFNRFAIACFLLDEVGMAHAAGRLEQLARDRGPDAAVTEIRQRLAEDRDFERARSSKTFASLLASLDRIIRPRPSLPASPKAGETA